MRFVPRLWEEVMDTWPEADYKATLTKYKWSRSRERKGEKVNEIRREVEVEENTGEPRKLLHPFSPPPSKL